MKATMITKLVEDQDEKELESEQEKMLKEIDDHIAKAKELAKKYDKWLTSNDVDVLFSDKAFDTVLSITNSMDAIREIV